MDEISQLVPYTNCWNSVAVPVKFKSWIPNAIAADSFPSPQFALTLLPQDFAPSFSPLAAQINHGVIYVYQSGGIQIDETVVYVHQPSDDVIVQNTLVSLTRLFACQADEVVEALAEYISPLELRVDGPWNGQRQELIPSDAVSTFPRDRQVCLETAAKDHVIHLETITLAEEQVAPTASAVGQILISGREVWMTWKRKLLDLLSRSSRNHCSVGFQITLASAAQISFC